MFALCDGAHTDMPLIAHQHSLHSFKFSFTDNESGQISRPDFLSYTSIHPAEGRQVERCAGW
jgi:hypothetical protein